MSQHRTLTRTTAAFIIGLVIIAAVAGIYFQQRQAPSPVGGTITLAVGNQQPCCDPLFSIYGEFADTITYHVFEGLVAIDMKNQFVPYLASSWDKTDQYTYVFHLRQGVKFHDGTPFNSTAVKFLFDRMQTETKLVRQMNSVIQSVDLLDQYNVRFNLKKDGPFGDFLYFLGWPGQFSIISPTAFKASPADFPRKPIGTGPFKIGEWVDQDHVTLIANEDYWLGRPNLDKIIIRIVPEESVRALQIERGEVQVAEIGPATAKRLSTVKGVTIRQSAVFKTILMSLNLAYKFNDTQGNPALKNKLVRQAINYAVDRRAIIDAVESGYATPANSPILPADPTYDSSVKMYSATADVDKAKQLLAQAGYSNGFQMSILTASGFVNSLSIATILQQQLAKVNIKVTIDNQEFGVLVDRMFQKRDYDAAIHDSGWAPPSTYFQRYGGLSSIVPGGANLMNIKDPTITADLNRLTAATTPDQQKEAANDIAQVILDQGYGVWMYYVPRILATTDKLTGDGLDHPFPRYSWGVLLSMKIIGVDAYLKKES